LDLYNHLRRNTAQNLPLQLQVKLGIELFHPFCQQCRQPRVIVGAWSLNANVALKIHHIGGDGIQLATQFAHIVDIQRDRGAFSRQIDDLGFWLGFGSFQGRFGFFQLGLARLGNRAVDSAGQCRSLGHQRAGTAQGGRSGIHITLLQHDLAAAQVGFGQLPLVLLKGSIVG
jgi:hypothetical protein